MSTIILAVGFTRSGTDPVDPDAAHMDMDYGFAQQDGASVSALGSSGASGRIFEKVNVNAQGNNFRLAALTPDAQLNLAASFLRVSFRPSHDTMPTPSLVDSPFNPSDTASLVHGLFLSSMQASANPTGTKYGLPAEHAYATLWQTGTWNFAPGAHGSQGSFEITVELKAVYADGTVIYFKVDPELIIQY
jgi:hypothetical protein